MVSLSANFIIFTNLHPTHPLHHLHYRYNLYLCHICHSHNRHPYRYHHSHHHKNHMYSFSAAAMMTYLLNLIYYCNSIRLNQNCLYLLLELLLDDLLLCVELLLIMADCLYMVCADNNNCFPWLVCYQLTSSFFYFSFLLQTHLNQSQNYKKHKPNRYFSTNFK